MLQPLGLVRALGVGDDAEVVPAEHDLEEAVRGGGGRGRGGRGPAAAAAAGLVHRHGFLSAAGEGLGGFRVMLS